MVIRFMLFRFVIAFIAHASVVAVFAVVVVEMEI
jgi:hypothetical protein